MFTRVLATDVFFTDLHCVVVFLYIILMCQVVVGGGAGGGGVYMCVCGVVCVGGGCVSVGREQLRRKNRKGNEQEKRR